MKENCNNDDNETIDGNKVDRFRDGSLTGNSDSPLGVKSKNSSGSRRIKEQRHFSGQLFNLLALQHKRHEDGETRLQNKTGHT